MIESFIKDYILTINTFTPLIGMFLVLVIAILGCYGKKRHQNEQQECTHNKTWALVISLIFAGIPIITTSILMISPSAFQMVEKFKWIESAKIDYSLKVDGLSLALILLTEVLTILSIIVYWRVHKNYKGNPVFAMILMLILEVCCIGVFSANDLVLFYIFFEASLIPMLFIIGIWGREERMYASLKLFIYTIFGSMLFLLSIIYLKSTFGTSEISELKTLIPQLAPHIQKYLWICMFIAFAIKMPMLPFHTWLPDAHVQAPTFGSMMLAGVIIKMGGYAMIKILLPLFPSISSEFSHIIAYLSVIAIVYGSLVALGQKDVKKLVAYSSVAHMGYVTLGIFVPCGMGYSGAVFQMISHGIISSGLFMCLGFLYERTHTFEIEKIHSLATRMKFFSIIFMILTLGSVGLPGTSGFIGEFLVILSSLSRDGYLIYGIITATGVVFGAVYMLLIYKKMFMEHKDIDYSHNIIETPTKNWSTNLLENSLLIIFSLGVIYFGLQPMKIISKINEVDISDYSNCSVKKTIVSGEKTKLENTTKIKNN